MLRILLAILLLIPLPVLAYHVPTQAPYDTNASNDSTAGTFTIGILGSDGAEDSPPENYTIFFSLSSGITETNSFCVTTSFGHQTNTWQYYTFSLDDLKYYFNDPAGKNIYYRVRANNETDNSVSTLTNETSWNLYAGSPFDYNQENWSAPTGTDACNPYVVTTTTTTTTTTIPPAVPDDATNVSVNYQGKDVYFSWEYTDGNTVAKEFHINYSYDNATWERVIITDTTARTYILDYTNIQTGTFYWIFGVCGDLENGESCTDSDSNNFETTEYIPPTTTTVYVPPPPPPPPPEPETVEVVMEDGSKAEYKPSEVEDGTVDRDNQRKANKEKYGCYMTDAQIERGDCDIITDDEKPDTETELPDDDVVVLEVEPINETEDIKDEFDTEPIVEEDIVEEEIKIDAEKLEEDFKFEEPEIIIEDIPEDIVIIIEDDIVEETPEIPVEVVEDEPIKEDIPEVLEEDTSDTTLPPVEIKPEREEIVLTEEEVAVEVAEVEDIVEDIVVEEATVEEVVEVLEQVNDIGVQNLNQATEEVQEVVQAVVEEAIADVAELTEEQVEVVAEVLQVQTEDVEIIAEAVKEDEVVAEAVEEYVKRAVKNADVEDYTLADVVTEVQYEAFIENPIEVLIDFDNITDINLTNISDDMTQDQKEKAQEVVVPVILTRIASMAAFIFRRS